MARSGAFGGTLNPFGSGSFSNLGAYNIGQDLADLAIYEAEIGWGNGTVSDTDYLAALQHGVDVTDVGSHARVSAVNKLQDANYRIGREKASLAGLDQVIAFDQTSLASMNPDNLKYRSVQENLAAELAQRRSRDYGKLVTDYNAGHGSTQSLLDWVNNTLSGLPSGAPDADNWASVKSDLGQRLQTEQDAKVYQDYQHNRIKGPAFLAYVKSRRDGYDPNSPDYADWSRKLEDATKSVTDNALAAKDQAFFDAYNNGHKSDKQYLSYLSNRIKTMDPNDPSLPQWKQRLTQAAHSIAEDELRFAVQTGKRPVSDLVSFYQHYRRTLNPNSPEYRQVTRAIMSLAGASGGGGGGGGRNTGRNTVGGDPTKALLDLPTGSKGISRTLHQVSGATTTAIQKVISPQFTLDTVLHLMTVNPVLPQLPPHATKAQKAAYKDAQRNQKAALDSFDLNHTSLMNAVQRGDATWAFYDPRKKLGSAPIMLPTSGTALANMDMLEAQFQTGLASVAMANHDAQAYYKALTRASNAQDAARVHYGQAVITDDRPLFKKAQSGIDLAMATGDYATALNLANDLQAKVKQDMTLPGLDDTRRAELAGMLEKLANNPLLPTVDGSGNLVMRGADIASSPATIDPSTGRRVFTTVNLNAGYHLVLDNAPLSADGTPPWKLAFDGQQDGTWEQNHVTVQTSYGDRVVTGDVSIGQAKVSPNLLINGQGDLAIDKPPPGLIQSITFTDQSGRVVTAYSSDGGTTWVKPEEGQTLPRLDLEVGQLSEQQNDDGSVDYYSADEPFSDPLSNPVYSITADGALKINVDYTNKHSNEVGFLNVDRAIADLPSLKKYTGLTKQTISTAKGGSTTTKDGKSQRNLDLNQGDVGFTGNGAINPETGRLAYDVGAPGQQMTVIQSGPNGSINLTTPPLTLESALADYRARHAPVTISPTGLGGNFYTPTLPSTAQQMPDDTPDRYVGFGLGIGGTLGPVVNIPKLNAITVPGIAPVKKPTAPKPLALAKGSTPGGQRNIDLLEPLPKPKPIVKPKPLSTAKGIKPAPGPHAGAL